MNIRERVERAFGHRDKPHTVTVPHDPITPEERDALWFAGRDWRDITHMDWGDHPDAFFAFSPEAFSYYLPSILLAAAESGKDDLLAADSLLTVLDRSPNIHWWDSFLTERLLGLEPDEYETIKEWILLLSSPGDPEREDVLARAYQTIDLLQRETDKARRLMQP